MNISILKTDGADQLSWIVILHNWMEYNSAKTVVGQLFKQYQHGKLSENDEKEMNELAKRVACFEQENEIGTYGKDD